MTTDADGRHALGDPFARDALEAAIVQLEALLGVPGTPEDSYQRYFEANPAALAALGYRRAVSQPRLPIVGDGHFIPDFLVDPDNRPPEVLDLKTPDERIIIDRARREKFTAKVESYISQLHDYREYFGDAVHRQACTDLTGLMVPADPAMVMIVGRDSGLDRLAIHNQLQRRNQSLRIVTFDDVRADLLREHASRYGATEDLAGISIYAVVSFHSTHRGRRRYLLDAREMGSSSRCSVYLDEVDRLTFEVTDRHATAMAIKAGKSEGFELGRFYFLSCSYGASDDLTVLDVRLDDNLVAEQRLARRGDLSVALDPELMTVGADVAGTNNGAFDLAELCIFGKILPFSDRLQLALYFAGKYFPESLVPPED
jgi:hypothetical protein